MAMRTVYQRGKVKKFQFTERDGQWFLRVTRPTASGRWDYCKSDWKPDLGDFVALEMDVKLPNEHE